MHSFTPIEGRAHLQMQACVGMHILSTSQISMHFIFMFVKTQKNVPLLISAVIVHKDLQCYRDLKNKYRTRNDLFSKK